MLFSRGMRACAVAMFLLVLMLPYFALAQGSMPEQIVPCSGRDCTVCHIATLAQRILNTGIFIAVFMSAVLFAWAGFKMMTAKSTGNEGGLKEGKSIFWNVMVGLIIILAAWLLVDTIFATLTGNHLWNKLC